MARDDGDSGLRARVEDPLEDLLGRDGLARLGAVMAVDGDGVLRGIVTIEAVQRALRRAAPAVAAGSSPRVAFHRIAGPQRCPSTMSSS